ncbi:unnamed protein product [Tenebrio molitor]|nr:unnamed protein product [Tenebrio molitor]
MPSLELPAAAALILSEKWWKRQRQRARIFAKNRQRAPAFQKDNGPGPSKNRQRASITGPDLPKVNGPGPKNRARIFQKDNGS